MIFIARVSFLSQYAVLGYRPVTSFGNLTATNGVQSQWLVKRVIFIDLIIFLF